MKSYSKSLSFSAISGVLALLCLQCIALVLRLQDFNNVTGARNLDATQHVLLTVTALRESPITNHWLLPTVSLGRELDKEIPWGVTIPTATGDYIYTSFPPAGFLAPYGIFSLFKLDPSIANLASFNFVLGVMTSLVIFSLLWNMLRHIAFSAWKSCGGALIGSSIAIFSSEALLSHGIVYWIYCLYQLVLAISLWFVFKYISEGSQTPRKTHYAVVIVSMALLGACVEWSGYVFNSGLVLLFWFGFFGVRPARTLAIQIFLATAAAGVLTLTHFTLVLGLEQELRALLERFHARDASKASISAFVRGYGLSYGWFLIVLAASPLLLFITRYKNGWDYKESVVLFILAASSIPLLENFLLMEHATEYSFDRLKFVFPAGLVLAVAFCQLGARARIAYSAAIVLCCVQGFASYWGDLARYSTWSSIDSDNKKLVRKISSSVDMNCSTFTSRAQVRGYANLLFHRGIYEYTSAGSSLEYIEKRGACAVVSLNAYSAFRDLQAFTQAIITYRDGSTLTIGPLAAEYRAAPPVKME